MTEEPELLPLTDMQLDALRQFASFKISFQQMRLALAGAFEISFGSMEETSTGASQPWTATGHFRLPEHGIVIARHHIEYALELKRADVISERDLVYWATTLLLNDAYVLDPADEDLIAEWLNDISLNLDAR